MGRLLRRIVRGLAAEEWRAGERPRDVEPHRAHGSTAPTLVEAR